MNNKNQLHNVTAVQSNYYNNTDSTAFDTKKYNITKWQDKCLAEEIMYVINIHNIITLFRKYVLYDKSAEAKH